MRYHDILTLYRLDPETSHGYGGDELATALAGRGFSLPGALLEYYRLLGKNEAVNHTFNRILPPGEVYRLNGHIVFFAENQGVAYWAVREADAAQEDPPVYATYDGGESWIVDSVSVAAFLTGMALWQAALGDLEHSGNTGSVTRETYEAVKARFPLKPNLLEWDMQQFMPTPTSVINTTLHPGGAPNDLFLASGDEGEFKRLVKALGIRLEYRGWG